MASNKILAAALLMTVVMIASLVWWTHHDSIPSVSLVEDTAKDIQYRGPHQTGSTARSFRQINDAPRKEASSNKQDWKTLIRREIDHGNSNHDELNRHLGAWLAEDPMGAIDSMLTSARDTDFVWINGTISEYLQQEEGYPEKLAIFDRLNQDSRIVEGMLGTALVGWARGDNASAIRWLNLNPKAPGAKLAAKSLGTFIGESGKALELLNQIKLDTLAPEIRESYATALIEKWSSYDSTNAADWINQNRQAPEVESAIPAFVGHAVSADVESAMIWAESIHDAELRNSTILQTAMIWRQMDLATYGRWKQHFATQGSALVNDLPSEYPAAGESQFPAPERIRAGAVLE